MFLNQNCFFLRIPSSYSYTAPVILLFLFGLVCSFLLNNSRRSSQRRSASVTGSFSPSPCVFTLSELAHSRKCDASIWNVKKTRSLAARQERAKIKEKRSTRRTGCSAISPRVVSLIRNRRPGNVHKSVQEPPSNPINITPRRIGFKPYRDEGACHSRNRSRFVETPHLSPFASLYRQITSIQN